MEPTKALFFLRVVIDPHHAHDEVDAEVLDRTQVVFFLESRFDFISPNEEVLLFESTLSELRGVVLGNGYRHVFLNSIVEQRGIEFLAHGVSTQVVLQQIILLLSLIDDALQVPHFVAQSTLFRRLKTVGGG